MAYHPMTQLTLTSILQVENMSNYWPTYCCRCSLLAELLDADRLYADCLYADIL